VEGIVKVCRKSRIQGGRLKALIPIKHCRSPLPYTTVVSPPVSSARRGAVDPMAHSEILLYTSEHDGYSRQRMPVTEPDIPSSFIAALEFIVEETEFSLRREASTANECVSGETVIIGDDGPKVGDFYRDWSIKSTDLGVRRRFIRLTRNRLGQITHHNVTIMHHPRFRDRDLPFSRFPVFVELTVGDRAPLDAELAHVNLVTRVFIIPTKFVVPHIEGSIVSLEIIMAKLDSSGPERDSYTGGLRGSIPGFSK
jgi:hypothetical protein